MRADTWLRTLLINPDEGASIRRRKLLTHRHLTDRLGFRLPAELWFMMTSAQLEQFVDNEVAKYGLPSEPAFPGNLKDLFVEMGTAHYYYLQLPATATKDQKVLGLQSICTSALRYLEGTRVVNNEFAGRIAAAIELNKQARAELRPLLTAARSRARNNFLKLMPKETADGVKSAKAAQNWETLKTLHNKQGGKKLNEEYWKEVFDPHHRPPYSVGKVKYKQLFEAWHKIASPYLDEQGQQANPDYDPTFRESFFDFLDRQGNAPPGADEYKYLTAAEREASLLIVRAGLIHRKRGGQVFSTAGLRWELNNGFKNQNYEGSAQSMLRDHGIWVMGPDGAFYSAPQWDGLVNHHHSALLSGAPIAGGGEWHVVDGKLKVITGSSGHYTPSFENFQKSLRTLQSAGIELDTVAAEWLYKTEDGFRYFNAKQLAMASVKAGWLGWPKIGPRPLQPVYALDPFRCQAIDLDVAGRDYPAEPPRGVQKTQITESGAMQGKVAAAKASLGRVV